jgi:hypothetical protein
VGRGTGHVDEVQNAGYAARVMEAIRRNVPLGLVLVFVLLAAGYLIERERPKPPTDAELAEMRREVNTLKRDLEAIRAKVDAQRAGGDAGERD